MKIDSSKYNKWENGKNRPDYETVCLLAEHFEVTTDYLLGRSDVKQAENMVIIETLGLTDAGIKKLMQIKNTDFENDKTKNDPRTLMDVLNQVLESSEILNILNGLKRLSGDNQKDLKIIYAELGSKITRKDVHRLALIKLIDQMLSSMEKNQ